MSIFLMQVNMGGISSLWIQKPSLKAKIIRLKEFSFTAVFLQQG